MLGLVLLGMGRCMVCAIWLRVMKFICSDSWVDSFGLLDGVSDRCRVVVFIIVMSDVSQCDIGCGERSWIRVR